METEDLHIESGHTPEKGRGKNPDLDGNRDIYADKVIAQISGLRAVKPGLRQQRYRQGV